MIEKQGTNEELMLLSEEFRRTKIERGVLNRWVKERDSKILERNARGAIINAIEADTKRGCRGEKLNPQSFPFKNLPKLQEKLLSMNTGEKEDALKLSKNKVDSITGESFTVEVVWVPQKGNFSSWIGRETRSDGTTISETRVDFNNGDTSLTLDATGEGYENANPHIIQNRHLPEASAKVLELDAGSVLGE